MRDFRRLPPLLRTATIFALLFALAGIALLVGAFVTGLSSFPPRWSVDSSRVEVIGLNLVLLGGSCSFVDQAYSARFRRPGRGPSPLDSWQGQVRAIALLAALPLCALALAAVIPPTSSAFEIVFPVTLIGALASFGANLWMVSGRQVVD